MQHLMVAIWRAISSFSTRMFTDTGIDPAGLARLLETVSNHKAPDTALPVKVMNKHLLATMSPAEKDRYWAVVPVVPFNGKQIVVEALAEIPEVQCRPSTRRRG
jgi:hypothetical protein